MQLSQFGSSQLLKSFGGDSGRLLTLKVTVSARACKKVKKIKSWLLLVEDKELAHVHTEYVLNYHLLQCYSRWLMLDISVL